MKSLTVLDELLFRFITLFSPSSLVVLYFFHPFPLSLIVHQCNLNILLKLPDQISIVSVSCHTWLGDGRRYGDQAFSSFSQA